MLSINRNILIAYLSRGWTVVLALLLTPLYVKIMGIEAYAIVGITFSIQAVMCMLDFGFGGAITLNTAALAAQNRRQEMNHLFRTAEILYWAGAMVLFAIFLLSSKVVSATWFHHVSETQFNLKKIIVLMGAIIISQWPCMMYSGALMGMQRQDVANKLNIAVASVRGALALVVLLWISPTIEAFLIAQIFSGFLQTATFAIALWRLTNGGFLKGRFDKGIFVETGRKALKMCAIAVSGVLLYHIDKIVLSRHFELKIMGYYCFCWTLVNGICNLCAILNGLFGPRFAHAVASNDSGELVHSYHQGAQWIAVIIFPITCFFLFFSKEILLCWTGDLALSEKTYVIAGLLVAGACLNCLTYIPHCFQLAHQWMKLTIAMNCISLILYPPLLLVLSVSFGVIGACCAWVLLQLFFLCTYVQIMHRKLIPGEKKNWMIADTAMPLAGALTAACVCRGAATFFAAELGWVALIAMGGIIFFACALSSSVIRPVIFMKLKELRSNA